MQLAIPLAPPPLDEVLAFIQVLEDRPDLALEPLLTEPQWERAVTAAVVRGDRDGLAILLQVELVSAITGAMTAMADTVRCAVLSAEDPSDLMLSLAECLEPTQRAVKRASKAVWAGEHRQGLVPGFAGPCAPRPNAGQQVWAQMATYLNLELASDDVRQAIADDLSMALRQLAAPARAAIDCMDAGEPDDLLPYPLQQSLFETHDALSAVRLHLLASYLAESMAQPATVSGPG